jgi:hypothetical protein
MVILKVFSGIYTKRWMPVDLMIRDYDLKPLFECNDALLVPWLDTENLKTDPMKFWALLHARTKYDIDDWFIFDLDQTFLGWSKGGYVVEYADCSVVMYGTRHGEVVPRNAEAAHRWEIIGFPRAQVVLKAQGLVMQLLRGIVEDILEGVEGTGAEWTELTSAGFHRTGENEAWSVFTNQGFSEPPLFKIDRLLEIWKTKLAEAEDNMWLLQTDPAYLLRAVQQERSRPIVRMYDTPGSYELIARQTFANLLVRVTHCRGIIKALTRVGREAEPFTDTKLRGRDGSSKLRQSHRVPSLHRRKYDKSWSQGIGT